MSIFQFKQFDIIQEKSAMKVGTDGVLLGAWTDVSNTQNVLDIGTGTGLISLMLAQKNLTAEITALEIDEQAFLESQINFSNSKWNKRLKAVYSDIKNFDNENKFDLIVSNPPFYNNTFQAINKQRNIARHTDSITFDELVNKVASLLSKNGRASFIIPFSEENHFISTAKTCNLYLNKKLLVKGNINAKIKRSLLEFSFAETEILSESISIEISRHQYTKEYIELVKDFYLKM